MSIENCVRCNTYPGTVELKVNGKILNICTFCSETDSKNKKLKPEKWIKRSIKRYFYPDTIGLGNNKK